MTSQPQFAIGPENPDFGSWNWLGVGLVQALSLSFQVTTFVDHYQPPIANVIVFLKFIPPIAKLAELSRAGCRLVFLPVDIYGSSAEIDNDKENLAFFDLIVVQSRRLERYFNSVSRTAYLDHPLKYVLRPPRTDWRSGPCLWVGRRCNLPPLVSWANRHSPEFELWVMTEGTGQDPREFGFLYPSRVRLGNWTEASHLQWLSQASIGIDIKGDDFRSRHKPPAKAFDFLASGIPVLTNPGSSVELEMAERGVKPLFDVPKTNDQVSSDYIAECLAVVTETAHPDHVWQQMQRLLQELF